MNNTSFKGRFISSLKITPVKSINPPLKVSAVEINPIDNCDIKALKNVHSLWNGAFTKNIYNDAHAIKLTQIPSSNEKFFILTKQTENFDNINPEMVLAEAKIITNNPDTRSIYLDYLQVEPDNMHEAENRIYKGIGSKMLDFLKLHYKNKDIHLHAVFSTLEFYAKNGFHPIEQNSRNLFYSA